MKNETVKGLYLMIEDKGPVSQGSSTSLYEVVTVFGIPVGQVTWHNAGRRYCFSATRATTDARSLRSLNSSELTELVTFLDRATKEHKADWKQTKQKERSLKQKPEPMLEPDYEGRTHEVDRGPSGGKLVLSFVKSRN